MDVSVHEGVFNVLGVIATIDGLQVAEIDGRRIAKTIVQKTFEPRFGREERQINGDFFCQDSIGVQESGGNVVTEDFEK